ncbi:MAG: D-alanyl-D-alanine endopeptidase [Nitrosomonadaceae bacterium]
MKKIILALSVVFIFASGAFAQPSGLNLRSHSAFVFDTQQGRVIYRKKADSIMPIASITKLMTAMVVLDAKLSMTEKITIKLADVDRIKNTRSRLSVGSSLTRKEMLRLALMSSENRAAAALGRTYPGGTKIFVVAMNNKAFELGMGNSLFVESTGLSSANVSTARDLAKMVEAAYSYEIIRKFTTTAAHAVKLPHQKRSLLYKNSNSLVRRGTWDIGVSKTGFLKAAGRCLVMQVQIIGKPIIIVLLDSWGKNTRYGDVNRIKKWMEKRFRPKT